jgi:hypothetical protein
VHSTDYYESQRTRPAHRHAWYALPTDAPRTKRCECGARCGVLTSTDLHPPGLSDEYVRQVLAGMPAVGKAPRLPKERRR